MTLTRPAWSFTVTNLDKLAAWSAWGAISAGDEYDDTQPIQLTDKMSLSWSFENDQVPGETDPDVLQFGFFVKRGTDLPPWDKGDRIQASLFRPLAVGTSVYQRFNGRISDADTELDPRRGVELTFTCVDANAELSPAYNFGPGPNPQTNLNDSIGKAIQSYVAAIYHYNTAEATALVNHSPNGQESIRDHVRKLLNTSSSGEFRQFLRCEAPFISYPGGWATYPDEGRNAAVSFYPHTWKRGILALPVPLLKFAMSASDPDRVTLRTNSVGADPYAGNADTQPAVVGMTVLPGRVVKAPQKLNLNKGTAPNRVELSSVRGFDSNGDQVTLTYYSEDPQNMKRYGAVVRSVETYGDEAAMQGKATNYLAYAAPGATWAADEIALVPDAMTDAELDRWANNFWPNPRLSFIFRRHIAILDIDADVDVTAGMLFGDLIGASFVIEGGKLEIRLKTKPAAMYFPNGRPGPTVNAWNASAYANTYCTDQGGSADYIDPNVTFDHVSVATL